MNRCRRQTGFTLVELVTCIIILGIISAVAGPKLLDNNTLAARAYSDEVSAALREAQAVSMGSGCPVAVTFTVGSYQALQPSNAPPACSGGFTRTVMRADGSTLAGMATGSITLSPATRIVFDAQGAVSSGPPPTLTIGTYRVSVDVRSGVVTLQ